MTCKYCNGTGWLLYKDLAPSPPYPENTKLEFGQRCACEHGERKVQRVYKNYEREEDQI